MNRKQRRRMAKQLGFPFSYLTAILNREDNIRLYEGDKVKINLKKITEKKDYPKFTEKYKKFVNDNDGVIFTVKYAEKYQDNPTVVSLEEAPEWLFFEGDLIRVEEGGENNDGV